MPLLTGVLDGLTLEFMSKARCGNKDTNKPMKIADLIDGSFKVDEEEEVEDMEDVEELEVETTSTTSTTSTTMSTLLDGTDSSKQKEEAAQSEEQLVRRKRFVQTAGVPTWVSPEFNFQFPITVGFKDYSDKMSPTEQDAALVYCATVG